MINIKNATLLALALSVMASCKPAQSLPGHFPKGQEPIVEAVIESSEDDSSPQQIVDHAPEKHILRIESTTQGYNPFMPWNKDGIQGRSGFGVLLDGGYILTSADMVRNNTFMSFAQHDNAKSYKAKLIAVDYEANLALLAPDSESDKEGLNGVEVTEILEETSKDMPMEVWQVAEEGYPILTQGTVQAYEMGFLSDNSVPFLSFLFKAPLQNNNLDNGVPVMSGGKLAGVIKSYNNSGQISQVLDASVVHRFYQDALDAQYVGFPSLGISVKETTDPTFRKFLKLEDDNAGIYVNGVHKKSGAAKAGLQKGDVIVAIEGKKVDHRGYASTKWGELSWESLLFENNKGKVGDVVQLTVRRDGQKLELPLTLDNVVMQETIIPDNLNGRAPRYIIHGGLVFIELSKPYLMGFGDEWESRAPVDMVAAINDSSEYEKKGLESIVILAGCISSSATLGYNSVQSVIVDSFNGIPVKSLKHLAELINADKSDIQSIGINRTPFSLYVSKEDVKASNEIMKKRITPVLQRLD